MRDARVADFRRKIVNERGNWPVRLASFSYEEVPGIGSGIVSLDLPFVTLTGPNGVGKSTLAKCLLKVLVFSDEAIGNDLRMAAGKLKVEGLIKGIEFERERNLGLKVEVSSVSKDVLSDTEIIYLDSARAALELQRSLISFEDVDELTNGVSPIELDKTDLAAISRIVCRDYRSVRAYEVDVGGIHPFFEVSYGSASYTSTTMGDGELAALIIWWTFWRAKEGSIIILEEPESFLSAMCQKNVCEYILSVVATKSLVCVASSHSSNFLAVAPDEGIRFFSRTDAGVHCVDGAPPPVLLKSIGVVLQKRGHLFVEDSAGMAFVKSILERFNSSLARMTGVSVSGGEGEVRNDLKRFSQLGIDLKAVGVFDGDIDAKTLDEKSVQLPGTEPVEVMFRRCAKERIERLRDISGVSAIDVILNSLEGKDHHDWLEDFARELGLDKGQAFNLLFRLWIEVPENAEAARVTAKGIADLLP